MKRLYSLLFVLLCAATAANAGPGDTTWVASHNGTQLSWYGDYDAPAAFPNGNTSYRKIYMIFTLGKYACPAGSQYCADWDYTVQNFLMTPTDTFEIGRLITPYANGTGMGANWTFRYVFDVTDYYPVLKNNAQMRVHYSGYSGGFTSKLDFAFIEGTPERNVLGIDRIYKGAHDYGNAANPIENHFPAVTRTAPAGTQSAELKFTVTGHGADNQGCSEFCSRWYDVLVNNTSVNGNTNIWKNDCGYNQVSAQNGTWIYDRGNWCPGELVRVNSHKLTGVSAGNSYNVNIDFEPYTSSGGASYITEGVVFYYGANNRTTDAALQVVKQPTSHEMFKRDNPICGLPTVTVRNTGTTPISTVRFEYGVVGSNYQTYSWSGTIPSMTEQDISLPESWALRTVSGVNTYEVKMLEVNGAADEDATNNKIATPFNAPARWGIKSVVVFKTNNNRNAPNGPVNSNKNKWTIKDMAGNIVAQRDGIAPNTIYNDTLTLGPSCYTFEMEDDQCDGLAWWANTAQGSGYVQILNLTNPAIVAQPNYLGSNFGCGYKQSFTTSWPTSVEEQMTLSKNARLEVFPTPAINTLNIALYGVQQVKGNYTLTDASGRIVWQQDGSTATNYLSVQPFANGLYHLVFRSADGKQPALHSKVLIAK